MKFEAALDFSIIQEILSKINGSGKEVMDALLDIYYPINGTKHKSEGYIEENHFRAMEEESRSSAYKLASEKLIYMMQRFVRDGFTTMLYPHHELIK